MPLSAPPDLSKVYIVVALSACLVGSILALNRFIYPVAGDSQHRLPFGGCYRDGTKAVIYNKPTLPRSSSSPFGKFEIFTAVVGLILLVVFLTSRKNRSCYICGHEH